MKLASVKEGVEVVGGPLGGCTPRGNRLPTG